MTDLYEMIDNAPRYGDLDFHYRMIDILKSFRDGNIEYTIPGKHACVTVTNGLSLNAVGPPENQKIVISHILENRFSRHLRSLEIGDELLSINGVAINTVLENMKSTVGAATPSGALRASLSTLTRIHGKTSKLPNHRISYYEFRKQRMNVTIPLTWIANVDYGCFTFASMVGGPRRLRQEILNSIARLAGRGSHESNDHITEFRHEAITPKSMFHPLFYHWVKSKIYQPDGFNVGVITIDNFGDHTSALSVAFEVRSLLLNELSSTNAILFDIRGSSGSAMTSAAELIPQFFKRDIVTGYGRVRVHPSNSYLIMNSTASQLSEWQEAYRSVVLGDDYSAPVKYTPDSAANSFGIQYTNPVGIFTNGYCKSSCEIFTAMMHDNGIATIFGEDETTAGVGSQAPSYNTFLVFKDHRCSPLWRNLNG